MMKQAWEVARQAKEVKVSEGPALVSSRRSWYSLADETERSVTHSLSADA